MSGAVLATIHGVAGSGGTLGPMDWTDIFSDGAGLTNTQTVSGITGTISMSAALSSGGTLHYIKNGTLAAYSGAFPVQNGDVIAWEVANFGTVVATGTATITDATHSTTVDTFAYRVRNNV